MDLGESGAHKFSVSLESKVRNKQAHQFFSSVSLVSCKCVSRRWKEWFPVSKYFFLKLLICSFLLLGHFFSPVLKLFCNTSNLGGLWFQLLHIFDTRELVTQ